MAAEINVLEMARNCVAAVVKVAELQEADPIQAQVTHAGRYGAHMAELAGQLALVVIAEDLHRILGLLEAALEQLGE